MKKIYIIIDENKNEYFYNLFFYFREFNFKILNLKMLLKSNEKRDLIFLNKYYHPLKNTIHKINELTDFTYLSEDKNIYYIPKDKFSFINNNIDILSNNSNNYVKIFDTVTEYNFIDHEYMIDKKDYQLVDFHCLCKLINENNIINLFNKKLSIKLIEDYNKIKYPNTKIFNHILIIDDKNIDNIINDLINVNLDKESSRYTLFFKIKYLNYEMETKIKYILSKFKNLKLVFDVYLLNNKQNITNILIKKLLYFENLVLYQNKINTDIPLFNEYLKYYDAVITDNLIIISAYYFCQLSLNDDIDRINLIKLLKLSLNNDDTVKVYNKPQKNKKMIIPKNYNHSENILFKLKDYNNLLKLIDNELKKNYDNNQTGILQVKKITSAILTQREDLLNEQILSILNNFNNIEHLKDIEILINNTRFNKIKKNIYLKLFDKTDDIKLCSKYLLILLQFELDDNNLKLVIHKLNTNKQILENQNKNIFLLFILKNLLIQLDKQDIINIVNEFIKENYQIDSINSIDGLLELGTKININKHLILIFLMSISTKFDNYYKTYDDFIKARETIKNNLLYIQNKIEPLNSNINLNHIILFSIGNFDLSYQGIPSPDIFTLRSSIFRKICPELNYKIDTNFKNKKIKILFHGSQLTRQHSVYKDRHQVIKNLSLDPEFEVYFSTFEELNPEVKFTFGSAKHIQLPRNLEKIRNKLSEMKLDIIVYCEIGMDNVSYFMAHMKLAKKQCNTWGHSDTSGIDTIDYFFSSKLYELEYEESKTHYTEKLILQNSLCTSYINPSSRHNTSLFKNRYHFGFTDETVIYFCAQSLFKFNPIYDDYIIKILSSVPNSVLIMLNSNNKHKFIERFNNKKIVHQMHFFPMMPHFDFLNLMNIADIILDIYPFGGCNSSMEAFSLNKVIVTQPSIMINGRFTNGFYIKMGLQDLICNNKDEYINFAVKLGLDNKYRNELENKISENKNVLFLDNETIIEWKNSLKKIYNY